MATNARRTFSERTNLALVRNDSKATRKLPRALTGRVISTVLALLALAIILRFLPPTARNGKVQAADVSLRLIPDELQLGRLQMSQAPAGEARYLDGVVTNTGDARVTGATVQVVFHDWQGNPVGSVEMPMVGVSQEGIDLVRNEFARDPIRPNEMRFFRVAIEQIPPGWNHEIPELKIVDVKAQ
jgi:hypothetical protein